MKEKQKTIKTDDGTGTSNQGLHYSEKGGHLLRGRYWEGWRKLFGNHFVPDYRAFLAPVETTWRIRRFMPRYGVQDGRR